MEVPDAGPPFKRVKVEMIEIAPRAVILIQGGKLGFLAGELPKGYVNAKTGKVSATGQLKDVINPRVRLEKSCPDCHVVGPCKHSFVYCMDEYGGSMSGGMQMHYRTPCRQTLAPVNHTLNVLYY